MDWFRWHHGTVNDPKFRVIARRSGQPLIAVMAVWAAMLENASMADARDGTLQNWSDEDVAVGLDIDPEAVTAVRQAMQGKTLDGDALLAWQKRQPKREDDSRKRVKDWRERKKQDSGNAARNADGEGVTQCNAAKPDVTLEEIRGEEIREEKKDTPSEAGKPPQDFGSNVIPVPVSPDKALFDYGVSVLGPKGRSTVAQLKKAKGLEGAWDVLRKASEKADPKEWVYGVLRNGEELDEFGLPKRALTEDELMPPEFYGGCV